MIQDDKFEDMDKANKFIEGVRCTQQLFRRMSTEEYQKEVAPFVKDKKKALDDAIAGLKVSYGDNYKDSVASWSAEESKTYKKIYSNYKNAQDRYRRKGLKKLAEERRKKALEEMTVNENGDVVFIVATEKKKVNKTADF